MSGNCLQKCPEIVQNKSGMSRNCPENVYFFATNLIPKILTYPDFVQNISRICPV